MDYPMEAKRLRESFKNLGNREDAAPETAVNGDHVEIIARLTQSPKDPVTLAIFKDGVIVATVDVTNGTFRRLKSEIGWFRNVHAGSLNGSRFPHSRR